MEISQIWNSEHLAHVTDQLIPGIVQFIHIRVKTGNSCHYLILSEKAEGIRLYFKVQFIFGFTALLNVLINCVYFLKGLDCLFS